VAVDQAAVAALADMPQVVQSAAVHAQEHALEVQLPFLQALLGDFSLVPLAVGDATPEQVAQVLERLWGGPETLIVISSDLSHFHGYDEARAIDAGTVKTILGSGTNISHHQACGATPVAGMLLAARHHGMTPQLLDYRNSGDTAGTKDRVVGYASFRFVAPGEERQYGALHRQRALQIARESIGAALGLNPPPKWKNGGKSGQEGDDSWLREHRASFVTLKLDGELRGCIGSLQAHRSLAEDIAHNAQAAAFKDPRFGPLSREEFARVIVEVSVLSPPKRLHFANHAELLRSLNPGLDGLILECGGRRGTFLPQVWEQLPDPEQFLAHLKNKAGLPTTTPSEQCRILRYTVVKWSEEGGSHDGGATNGGPAVGEGKAAA
jgi:AmmeMemoRadiSam system protein A